jgi:hypothetical protein
MSVDAGYLTELSELPVDLNLAYWTEQADDARGLWQALNTVDGAQQAERFRRTGGSRPRASGAQAVRVARLLPAQPRIRPLVCGGKPRNRIRDAAHQQLRPRPHRTATAARETADAVAARAVKDIYDARSDIVHASTPPPESPAIGTAQRAYLQCLEAVVSQLASVTAREADPLPPSVLGGRAHMPGSARCPFGLARHLPLQQGAGESCLRARIRLVADPGIRRA